MSKDCVTTLENGECDPTKSCPVHGKKCVRYTEVRDGIILIGYGVHIRTIDHPIQPILGIPQWAYTSPVVAYDEESGRIETMNTIYIKKEVMQ